MPERRDVVKHPDGWAVTKPGSSRASAVERTQVDANRRAAEILTKAGGGERVTHGLNGRIISKDTIPPARDPNPPRDTEH
jgi:Uncharacterized protein conserved in bacteria (DUF2188)